MRTTTWPWSTSPRAWWRTPRRGNPDGTLVNALLYHLDGLSGVGGEKRPGMVHRIDKDTSGLLLVAKNDRRPPGAGGADPGALGGARLSGRLHRPFQRGAGRGGRAHRPPPDRSQKKWPSAPDGRRAGDALARAGAVARGFLCRSRGWKRGARTKFACTWPPSATRCWATRCTGRKNRPIPYWADSFCTRRSSVLTTLPTGERMRFEAPPEPRFSMWLERLKMR